MRAKLALKIYQNLYLKMLTKRIIPCLDIKDGRTVKGINFKQLRDAGDPVALGQLYSQQGADELVFLDITATHENRKTLLDIVRRIAKEINIPFTVGGGINSIEDVSAILNAGADKVAVNSAAVNNPQLIEKIARRFGSQCIVLAVDAKQVKEKWIVYVHGGRKKTELELIPWLKQAEASGAGEVLFTSMDHDGTKNGFANSILAEVSDKLNIPVIASGGAGKKAHFLDVFTKGKADAALAASIFHFEEIQITELKKYLHTHQIPVRL